MDSQVRKTKCRQEQDLTPQGAFCAKGCELSEQIVMPLPWVRRRDSAEALRPPAHVWAFQNREAGTRPSTQEHSPWVEGVLDLHGVAAPLQKSIQRIQPNRKQFLFFSFLTTQLQSGWWLPRTLPAKIGFPGAELSLRPVGRGR